MSRDVTRDVIPFFQPHPFKLEDVYTGMLMSNINVTAVHHPQFQFSRTNCEYNDFAISLNFYKEPRNQRDCFIYLFKSMLSSNKDDEFMDLHYARNRKRR